MSTELLKKEAGQNLSYSERFTSSILKNFANNGGETKISSFQKKLCNNYFLKLDSILKDAENKRLAKSEAYRDAVPVTWANINMDKLAVDVISFSLIGLDPFQPNHINPIPYKNNKTNIYDVTFIPGYRGMDLKAKKYGYEAPDDYVVELVFENDKFKVQRKTATNKVESYTLETEDEFNRGEIKGGFYYHVYFNKPERNKLRVFTLADIEKRKPKSASSEFWGGEKDVWENKKKVGTEKIAGWYHEMVWKTIYRASRNDVTIDSEKIDEHFLKMLEADEANLPALSTSETVSHTISETGNKKSLDFDHSEDVTNKADEEPKIQINPHQTDRAEKKQSVMDQPIPSAEVAKPVEVVLKKEEAQF